MLGDALASRFDFGSQAVEDKYGRQMTGRRLSDDAPVAMTVLDPALKAGPLEANAAIEAGRKLADRMLATVLLPVEAGRTESGSLYLLAEHTPLEPLKVVLKTRGGLSPAEALSVAYRIASTLRDAASEGVNHLDLSSSTVHLDPGLRPKVRISGYGYSALLPTYSPARKNEPFHGTAEYMAPEVCAGRPGDAAADLYALGVLMYEMVAGKPPFVSSSPATTIKRQVYEKPLPLHLVKPGMSGLESYEKLVTRLLAKDPKGRPADAQEVMEAIASLKNEAFPDANLDVEPDRESVPSIVSNLQIEAPKAEVPAPALGSSRETMAFTGLAEAIAAQEALAARTAAQAPVPEAPREPVAETRPTEAFDASFIASAVQAAQAAAAASKAAETAAAEAPAPEAETAVLPAAEEKPAAEAGPAAETVPVAAEEKPMEAEEKTAQVDAEALQKMVEEARAQRTQGAAAAPESKADKKAAEDWFVEGGELPADHFGPEEREVKKESRMFWVILIALAVIAIIAAAVWLNSRTPTEEAPPPSPTAGMVQPPPGAVEKKPEPAPARVETPPPAPAPKPAEPTPAEKLKAALAKGAAALASDDLATAKAAYGDALALDAANADAKKGLAAVDVRQKALEAEAKKKAEADAKAEAEAKKKAEADAKAEAAAKAKAEADAKRAEAAEAAKAKAAAKAEAAAKAKAEAEAAAKAKAEARAAAKAKAEAEAAAKAKAEAAKPKPVEKPVAEKPVEKKVEAPAPMSDDQRQAKVKELIAAGRAAEKGGDYNAAIAKYSQALNLDKGNGLLQTLIDRAKAKAGQ